MNEDSREKKETAAERPSSKNLLWGGAGVLLFLCGLYALLNDIEKWNTVWYVPAWYGYLLFLDAWIFYRQKKSFLSSRKVELGAMLFWSIPFWFLFEGYNVVVRNWYYVSTPHNIFDQLVVSWVSYATVLPACFFHAELLKTTGWLKEKQFPTLTISRAFLYLAVAFGALCIVLPLIIPRYTFWMLWGIALAVPEVVNYRAGAPSLLRDLERGKFQRLIYLLFGGLWAGIIWEAINFSARCKWIYTVPGLEDWKLFEMPLLGFFGFPVLALGAFAYYSMISFFIRGKKDWDDLTCQANLKGIRTRYVLSIIAVLCLSTLSFLYMRQFTVRSHRPLLRQLPTLTATDLVRLRKANIFTPEQLYSRLNSAGASQIAALAEIDLFVLQGTYAFLSLSLHKGMGATNASLLSKVGVTDVLRLMGRDAEALSKQMAKVARPQGIPSPRDAEVKVWIRAAELWRRTKR